jgi:acyl carrier protein
VSDTPKQKLIHDELKRFVHKTFKVERAALDADPSFDDMGADSLTKLEILLHGDETFASHVLDYLEDSLLDGNPPTRLSELAALIPKCMKDPSEVLAERKRMAVAATANNQPV